VILALDPGKDKCGLALLAGDGTIVWHRIVFTRDLAPELERIKAGDRPVKIVIGSGTTSRESRALLETTFGPERVFVVDERDSTLEARGLYFDLNPPRGLWRLVPRGLLSPPGPIDDYAAIVLGRRWLAASRGVG
jgi:RNase H-fold protein (predicted Holliday junction resolvase)